MNSRLLPTLFILLSVFTFFSCERANNNGTTTVKLQLPNKQIANTEKIMSSIMPLNYWGGGGYTIEPSGSVELVGQNSYNSIIPTDDANKYPINCVMVVVYSAENNLNYNYCGNVSSGLDYTSDYKSSDEISKDFSFGPFAGLKYIDIDSSSDQDNKIIGSPSITIDVASGNNREFHLIGFHATTPEACVDNIKDNSFVKSYLSKPRLVATSFNQKTGSKGYNLLPGVSLDIELTRTQDPASARAYDDCVLRGPLIAPLANTVEITQDSFPYQFINRAITANGITNGYVCEPVEVVLKNKVSGALDSIGTVAEDTEFYIAGVSNTTTTVIPTFANERNCVNSYTYTSYGSGSFTMRRNSLREIRWIKNQNTDSALNIIKDNYYTVSAVNPPAGFTNSAAIYNLKSIVNTVVGVYVLDHVVPKKMMPDTCYKVSSLIKSNNGVPQINLYTTGTQTLSFSSATLNAVDVYPDQSTCVGSGTSISSVNIPYSGEKSYWIRAKDVSDPIKFNFSGTFSSNSGSIPIITSSAVSVVVDDSSSGSADEVGFLRAINQYSIPKYSGLCVPVYISATNRNGADRVGLSGSDVIKNIDGNDQPLNTTPIRFEVLDYSTSSSGTVGYQLYYNDPTCVSNTVYPIGVTGYTVSGTSTHYIGAVTPSPSDLGDPFAKFYIKPTSGTDVTHYGKRRLQIYFGGTATKEGQPAGIVEFELTDPTH